MNKELFKKIILENQERIPHLDVIPRDYNLSGDHCRIITGPRRAGKTFLIYRKIKDLLAQGIDISRMLYINFEDERLLGLDVTGLDPILESYKELFTETPYIFLDEIQNITGWQKFARRLADTGYITMITGSNAEMLSGEMASSLGGRYMISEIDTLSFPEYLRFKGIETDSTTLYSGKRFGIQKHFTDYFYHGGFPELIRFQDKKEYLNTIFQKIFLGDIIARNKIRNPGALRMMVKKLAESTMDEVSFRRIRNILLSAGISVGTATLIDYTAYFTEAFLLGSITNYKAKITERETRKKYYFNDHGLLSLFLIDPGSALLETIVYKKLKRTYADQVFYLRDNYEVDFYIPGEAAFQTAWSLSDDQTRKREIDALVKARQAYKMDKMFIITWSEEEEIKTHDLLIRVVPVWKWMLEG